MKRFVRFKMSKFLWREINRDPSKAHQTPAALSEAYSYRFSDFHHTEWNFLLPRFRWILTRPRPCLVLFLKKKEDQRQKMLVVRKTEGQTLKSNIQLQGVKIDAKDQTAKETDFMTCSLKYLASGFCMSSGKPEQPSNTSDWPLVYSSSTWGSRLLFLEPSTKLSPRNHIQTQLHSITLQ